jgi:anti-sigma regulatory factor (Ser/Thr protein kinase)
MPGARLRHPVELTRMLRLHADSRPDTLAQLRHHVRYALDQVPLAEQAAEDLEVAAGEVLSNVNRHAYPSGVGPLFVEVFRTRLTVTVLVIDEGRAAVPPAIPPSLPRYARAGGGRGLYLVQRLADELRFSVSPAGHGLAVRMTKWIRAPQPLPQSA